MLNTQYTGKQNARGSKPRFFPGVLALGVRTDRPGSQAEVQRGLRADFGVSARAAAAAGTSGDVLNLHTLRFSPL